MKVARCWMLLLGTVSFSAVAAPPVSGGCALFPANNPWNVPVDTAPVDPLSDTYVANINANGGTQVHPDFGSDPGYGIPHTVVGASQALVPMDFDVYDQSEPGPYPIPSNAPVEGGSDRHVLVVDSASCILYELYAATYSGSDTAGWHAFSGAVFDLNSNDIRPNQWTSSDAAGLPILPGLAKCDEANSGTIDHAFRFTVNATQHAFTYPATHQASSHTGTAYPPMGLRMRLKASYNLASFTGQSRAIALALKKYGMILADNGSNWYISGETNPSCWDDEDLNQLKTIPGNAFEAVVSPPPPSDLAGDLLVNGGFEAGRLRGALPGGWTAGGKSARICDDPYYGRTNADAGQCLLRFAGAPETMQRIFQTVTQNIPAGPLQLKFRAKPIGVPAGAGTIVALLTYADNTTRRFAMNVPGGSSAKYQSYALAVTPTKTVASIKVTFLYSGASGKLWLDQVGLVPVP
jgi:hypothetical protein